MEEKSHNINESQSLSKECSINELENIFHLIRNHQDKVMTADPEQECSIHIQRELENSI